uniref:Anoctamin n=1 Tax=Romanomermis culicivorax TaxID=13658 RepID=A0A915IG94_ROMCU
MYKVYKDAFILHEKSKLCKFFINLKKKSKEKFDASNVKVDPRLDLERTWNKFFKFQPLWKIRNYFGEEIAFHFAWQGYLISMMWFPALLGLISFVYGLYIT